MVTITSKALAIAALTTSLSPVWACLTFNGEVSSGLDIYGNLKVTDNGLQVCSGGINEGDDNLECIKGYSLNYDYGDNPTLGPLPVTYCNIAGHWYST
ncbi:hypothetical protein Egran_06130 [Elaphomyces granulatus]|uniref:Cyanovirin-N domain-containing protein n=1 Tax=Elaphomyces granulatus TaxID=519963 RepID=A0A232LPQ6_9EURO|nr:hypothetical protein Egran_06130 [Elaphomyces granulatus]